jgi:CDP-diacylglycerol--serine O-phosphatidyltransferase
VRLGVPANAVSIAGLAFGAAAAVAFHRWSDWRSATLGALLCVAWLIADGLDGMIARATGTASDLGRFLDGVCDHAVFVMLYVSLAASIGTAQAWILATCAGVAHALQATIYEGERTRFHRRIRADPGGGPAVRGRNVLVRTYDAVAGSLDRFAAPFDRLLATTGDPAGLAHDPRLFWWLELVPLSALALAGIWWHRRCEALLVSREAR